jgi:hypothetical protein
MLSLVTCVGSHFTGEGRSELNTYEIRILNQKKPALIYMTWQTDDLTAIRHAFSLLGDDDGIEVWRDLVCLYCRPLPGRQMN